MKIIFEDKEILFNYEKNNITVKVLLILLKTKISLKTNEELRILWRNNNIKGSRFVCFEDNEEIEVNNNNYEYILIKNTVPQQKQDKSEESIEALVMKVTGAKNQIPEKKIKKNFIIEDDDDEFCSDDQIQSDNPNLEFISDRLIFNEISNPFLRNSQRLDLINLNNQINRGLNLPESQELPINNNERLNFLINRNIINNHLSRSPVDPNPVLVKTLVDMGFSESASKKALSLCRNDLSYATDMILKGNDRLDNSQIEGNIIIDSNSQELIEQSNKECQEEQKIKDSNKSKEESYSQESNL